MTEKMIALKELSNGDLEHILTLMWLAEYQLIEDPILENQVKDGNREHSFIDVTSTLLVNRKRSKISRRAREIAKMQNEREYPLALIETFLRFEITQDMRQTLEAQNQSFRIKRFLS